MPAMKLSYVFAILLATNVVAVVVGSRGTKAALAAISAVLALYGLGRTTGLL